MNRNNIQPIIRGDTTVIGIEVKENGIPLDLSGATIFFTMKKRLSDLDSDAALQVAVSTHTEPSAGKSSITLSSDVTNDLQPGNYHYDVQLVFPEATVKTIMMNKVTVLADVTRRRS